jgi:hypothetical protein
VSQYWCKNGREVMVDIKIDTEEVRGDRGMVVGAQYQNPGRQSPFLGRWVVFSSPASKL